jgi:predicted transcriptional regulator
MQTMERRHRLRLMRRAAGLTQQDVADSAEYTRAYLASVEGGANAGAPRFWSAVARALGVSTEAFDSHKALGEAIAGME